MHDTTVEMTTYYYYNAQATTAAPLQCFDNCVRTNREDGASRMAPRREMEYNTAVSRVKTLILGLDNVSLPGVRSHLQKFWWPQYVEYDGSRDMDNLEKAMEVGPAVELQKALDELYAAASENNTLAEAHAAVMHTFACRIDERSPY